MARARRTARSTGSVSTSCWKASGPSIDRSHFSPAADHWQLFLRRFDQLHLAIARTVENHYLTFGIAEDEDIAIAKMGFFDGLFERHGTDCHCLVRAYQVNLGRLRNRRKLVHDHGGHRCRASRPSCRGLCDGFGRGLSVPLAIVVAPLL